MTRPAQTNPSVQVVAAISSVPLGACKPVERPYRPDEGIVEGREIGAELWRVPFVGWDELRELEATTWCRPRRYVVVDGLVRAAGYTSNDPTLLAGEVFRIRVPAPP